MTQKLGVYEMVETQEEDHKHTIAVLVDNEFGVLGRVIGLFSSRGYNIDSLTVSEVDEQKHRSRITIITHANERIIAQIMSLLERLVPVHEVRDLTVESPHIERSVGLVKVINESQEARASAQQLADRFGARTIDSTAESFIFELSDTPEKLDKFITLMAPYGVKEVCRTGATAIARGIDYMAHNEEQEEAP